MNGYETEAQRSSHVAALVEELAGCERAGNKERAALIREQLALFGHKASTPEKRAEKRPGRGIKVELRDSAGLADRAK